MDDALERAFAFVKAGADGIMIHSRRPEPDEIFEFVEKFRAQDSVTPLVVVPTSFNQVTEGRIQGQGRESCDLCKSADQELVFLPCRMRPERFWSITVRRSAMPCVCRSRKSSISFRRKSDMEQTIIEATTMEIQLKEVFEQHCTRQVLFVLGAFSENRSCTEGFRS